MELLLNVIISLAGLLMGAFMGSYLRRSKDNRRWTVLDEIQWWKEVFKL